MLTKWRPRALEQGSQSKNGYGVAIRKLNMRDYKDFKTVLLDSDAPNRPEQLQSQFATARGC